MNLTKLGEINIVLIISGFLISGIIPTFLGTNESSFTMIYRGIILLISLYIIINGALRNTDLNFSKKGIFILFYLFWILYTFRIIYDLLLKRIFIYEDKDISFYLLNAFGVVLLPCLSITLLNFNKINYKFILKWIYIFLLSGLTISLILRGQAEVVSNRSVGDINVGILQFGQYGATLCILSFLLFLNTSSSKYKFIFILGFILGFVAIFISASRSPFLALILTMLTIVLFKYASFKTAFLSIICSLLLIFFFSDILILLDSYFNSSFIFRLQLALSGDTGSREDFFGYGINSFIHNPFFGEAMLLQNDGFKGSYPHNLIIESFMATGFLGGFLFLVWNIRALLSIRKVISRNVIYSWPALIFFQYFIFAMFSGNLYSSNIFWLCSVLLIGISATKLEVK